MATFIGTFDANAVNLALPTISEEFPGGASRIGWVANAYLLPYAIFTLISGRLGDVMGRRRVFMTGAVVFALGSFGSVISPSFESLIATRILQGVGAALHATTAIAIVAATWTGAGRARAMGIVFSAAPIGVLAGPIAGGALAAFFGWRSIFAVQVLVASGIAVLAFTTLQSKAGSWRPLDLPGLLAATGFVVGMNVVLQGANEWGWTSARSLIAWGVVATALALFIVRERSTPDPAVRLSIFRSRRFVAASIAGSVGWFVIHGTSIQLSIYLQKGRGLGPLEAAMLLSPYALVAFVVFNRGGAVLARVKAEHAVLAGLIVIAASTYWCSTFDATTHYGVVVAVSMLRGGAMASVLLASMVDALGEFTPADAGVASATIASIRQIGSSFGVAVPAAAFDAAAGGVLGGEPVYAGIRAAFLVTFAVVLVATLANWLVTPRREVANA